MNSGLAEIVSGNFLCPLNKTYAQLVSLSELTNFGRDERGSFIGGGKIFLFATASTLVLLAWDEDVGV
jgi:hypothetical protein